MSEEEDTLDLSEQLTKEMDGGSEAIFAHISRRWEFYCPWCGRRATLNTVKPLTINCERCECTTEIRGVT